MSDGAVSNYSTRRLYPELPELRLSIFFDIPLICEFFELNKLKSSGIKVKPSDQPRVSMRNPL
jgi:hypothetical protein